MIGWIDPKEELPEIDYENKKSSVKVEIKTRSTGRSVRVYFRHIHQGDTTYGIFYDLKSGHVIDNVMAWKYI